jgi:hypothetical protein
MCRQTGSAGRKGKSEMKSVWKLGLAVLAVVVFGRATWGEPPVVTPVLKLKFTDHVRYHNMGIAWDGQYYYYTVSGGNSKNSDLNVYDDSGKGGSGDVIKEDCRAILYSPADISLYFKPRGRSLYAASLDAAPSEKLKDIFHEDESSVAMSPDGAKLYELDNGTVYVYNAHNGHQETSLKLSQYSTNTDGGYANAIAASSNSLFVWAPSSDKTVLVYTPHGEYVTKFELPRSGYGFSLSWANDMLWIAEDANGGSIGADGTWYGYKLKGLVWKGGFWG